VFNTKGHHQVQDEITSTYIMNELNHGFLLKLLRHIRVTYVTVFERLCHLELL
jgi:hypothetical protein